ncbi:MAG: hypothetical protein QY318_01490 [Candidatus Dojkabacteria bacterium]|nr:MAG: hypothetical protein QY318_01490 [Candidatus Dojkabacteria bacterium]
MSGEYPKRAIRIMEELEKAGLPYDFAYNDQISISLNKSELQIKVNGKDVREYTHIIFGGHHLHSQRDYEIKRLIVDVVDEHNQDSGNSEPIRVQNSRFIKRMTFYSKLHMAKICADYGLPFLATYYDRSGKYQQSNLPFPYPLIAKHVDGRNDLVMIDGEKKVKKNVYKLDNENGWKQDRLATKSPALFFIQEFADSGEDFRYFVSKGEVIGGWKRVAGDSFMTVNRKEGARYFYANEPDKKIRDICKAAADGWGVDFMALDFMYKDGEPHILEFSMNPGFDAYEKKCEDGEPTNIAEAIVKSF